MNKLCCHIIFTTVLCTFLQCTYLLAADTTRVVINCTPTFDGSALQEGDILNILSDDEITDSIDMENFPDDSGWGVTTSREITLIGDSGEFEFQVRSIQDSCLTTLVDFTSVDTTIDGVHQIIITSITASKHQVRIPQGQACTDSEPLQLSSNVPEDSYEIITSESGLQINEQKQIEPALSQIGVYSLQYSSDYCIRGSETFKILPLPDIHYSLQDNCDSVTFIPNLERTQALLEWNNTRIEDHLAFTSDTILMIRATTDEGCSTEEMVDVSVRKLRFLDAVYEKQEADCWKDGIIHLESYNVQNLMGRHDVILENTITRQQLLNLNEVPEGLYRIRVKDDRDCSTEYTQPITIHQKCLEDYPVFTPDDDGIEDRYFIPHEGSVKIFNREGVLVHELTTPDYWNGYDNAGNLLPMGNYLLLTNSGRKVNITLVR